MAAQSLDQLFSPKSIAIVGAAREKNKLGNIVVANIQAGGFAGKIFPVNPHATDINGIKCYPDYAAIPMVPDLAIVVLPAELVIDVVRAIAERGTHSLVVLSAGFKEMGGDGAKREQELRQLAKQYKLNILGPNCLGFVNNTAKLNATFGQPNKMSGNLRFILQSGALATSIFDWANTATIGFSDCITLGNKTVVTENEILSYWLENQKTNQTSPSDELNQPGLSNYRPIGLYLESIENGTEFLRVVKSLSTQNPVLILKPGASEAAQAAMRSHTGALANDNAVLGAALADAGAIRCSGIEDFFDLAKAFAWENAPTGPAVAVVSNAGGPGVLATDAIAAEGLELARITPATEKILAAALPRAANIHNPIDVLGDALSDRYRSALDAVLAEPEVRAVIVILTPQVMTQIEATAEIVGELSKKYQKPIFCSFMGGSLITVGEAVLNRCRIPSFRYPERAIKALATMWRWQSKRTEKLKNSKSISKPISQKTLAATNKIITEAKSLGQLSLPSAAAQTFAKAIGLNVPTNKTVRTNAEATAWAERNKYPVVLKISSTKLLHKTEAHGVIPGIKSKAELIQAFKLLTLGLKKIKDPTATIQIEQHITNGLEVIVGLKRDPSFGPVLVFGAGGIFTELIKDRNIAMLPLTSARAMQLIAGSKIGQILLGWRGAKPYAIDSLAALMIQLTESFVRSEQIQEMEINPVIITRQKAWAVDTKIILKP